MKMIVKWVIFALFFGVAAWQPAKAQENFTRGELTRVSNTVLCDTQEALEEIATAQQESWAAAIATYRKWHQTINPTGDDVVCAAPGSGQAVYVKPIEVVNGFVNLHTPTGDIIDRIYVIAVMWPYDSVNNVWRPGYIFARVGVDVKEKVGSAI